MDGVVYSKLLSPHPDEEKWLAYWLEHPRLSFWHALTAARHTGDEALFRLAGSHVFQTSSSRNADDVRENVLSAGDTWFQATAAHNGCALRPAALLRRVLQKTGGVVLRFAFSGPLRVAALQVRSPCTSNEHDCGESASSSVDGGWILTRFDASNGVLSHHTNETDLPDRLAKARCDFLLRAMTEYRRRRRSLVLMEGAAGAGAFTFEHMRRRYGQWLRSLLDLFLVFGNCTVTERAVSCSLRQGSEALKHQEVSSSAAVGTTATTTMVVVSYSGLRPQVHKRERDEDNRVDGKTHGSDDAALREHWAEDDAACALDALQLYFAVDFGLILCFDSELTPPHVSPKKVEEASLAQGNTPGGDDRTAFPEVKAPTPNTPDETAVIASSPHSSTAMHSGIVGTAAPKRKYTAPPPSAAPPPPVALVQMPSLQPAPQATGLESTNGASSAFTRPSFITAISPPAFIKPHDAAPANLRRLRLCPHDGHCLIINDPAHQQFYLHRCTLPSPCAYIDDPVHGQCFLH